jgi:hypothetical protein
MIEAPVKNRRHALDLCDIFMVFWEKSKVEDERLEVRGEKLDVGMLGLRVGNEKFEDAVFAYGL